MKSVALVYAFAFLSFILLVDTGALASIAIFVNEVPLADKVVHFTMFGLLALVVNAALVSDGRLAPVFAIVAGSLLVAIMATVEEGTNAIVPCRNCSLADLAANYLGIVCIGALPLVLWLRARQREIIAGWLRPRA